MSNLNLPKIINISKAAETKSKNFILHLTHAQWKKSISKSVIYKGKKNFSEFVKNVYTFNEIDGLNGGLLTAYMINKNGKKKNLFPVIEIIDNEKVIVFKPKKGGETNTCRFLCKDNSCDCIGRCGRGKSCGPVKQSSTVVGCVCGKLSTGN